MVDFDSICFIWMTILGDFDPFSFILVHLIDFDSFSTFCVTGFFLFWLVLIHLVHFVSLDSFYFGQF